MHSEQKASEYDKSNNSLHLGFLYYIQGTLKPNFQVKLLKQLTEGKEHYEMAPKRH